MRQEEQQVAQEQVRSAPVPGDHEEGTTDQTRTYDAHRRREAPATDGDRPEYHDPAPLPTAFGATTVSDAAAAAAMASGRPEDERDPRGEDTALPGDGAPGRTDTFDDERADPTAGDWLHDPERWAAGTVRDDAPTARRVPSDATRARPSGMAGDVPGTPGGSREPGQEGSRHDRS